MMISKKKFISIFLGIVILALFFTIGIFVERNTRESATGALPPQLTVSDSVGGETFGLVERTKEQNSIAPAPSETPEAGIPSDQRKIIKSGNLSLEVENVSGAVNQIRLFAEAQGGFVVESRIEENQEIPYGSVTIRIPSTKFDEAFGSIKSLAKKVVSEFVSGDDVTEEYQDLEAQLKNLEATEAQFLQILKDAKSVEDILAVHRELKEVRIQIDILKGRLQYLDRSVALSSLYISLSTDEAHLPVVKESEWRPLAVLKNAVRGLIATARLVVYAIIWILIFAVIWVPLLFLIRYFWRRYKSRRI